MVLFLGVVAPCSGILLLLYRKLDSDWEALSQPAQLESLLYLSGIMMTVLDVF